MLKIGEACKNLAITVLQECLCTLTGTCSGRLQAVATSLIWIYCIDIGITVSKDNHYMLHPEAMDDWKDALRKTLDSDFKAGDKVALKP